MSNKIIQQELKYTAHNYAPLDVVLTKADGCYVWDDEGHKYLDFLSAYSAVSFGHNNKRINTVFQNQATQLDVTSRAFYSDNLASYAEKLCKLANMDMMLPMNTGVEAVETAIKAARRWGYRVKGIPTNKAEILVAEGNFHGRTTTIVSFSSDDEYKADFGPYDNGFKHVKFGNSKALEKAITPNTCAFLVEPMQGEGGIIIPPKGWLKEVQAICKKHNVLLILDEIQTGMARTGKNFAYEHEIDKPDCLLLGKALGGGVYPVSAFLARKDVMDVFDPGSHGSTFGGNPIACAIGNESLDILVEEKLAERSAELGQYLKEEIQKINTPFITEIRGAGLWIGVDFDPKQVKARDVCEKLRLKGVLAKDTHGTVVRFAPPLTISKEQIKFAIQAIKDVLAELEK